MTPTETPKGLFIPENALTGLINFVNDIPTRFGSPILELLTKVSAENAPKEVVKDEQEVPELAVV